MYKKARKHQRSRALLLQYARGMAINVAADIDSTRETRDVGGRRLQMNRQSGSPAAEALRSDSKAVNLFQYTFFKCGVLRLPMRLTERTNQGTFCEYSDAFEV